MAEPESNKIPKVPPKDAQIRATLASRMINPELFIRPNKFVMGVGLVLITGCVVYLALMDSDGSPGVQKRTTRTESIRIKSKWD